MKKVTHPNSVDSDALDFEFKAKSKTGHTLEVYHKSYDRGGHTITEPMRVQPGTGTRPMTGGPVRTHPAGSKAYRAMVKITDPKGKKVVDEPLQGKFQHTGGKFVSGFMGNLHPDTSPLTPKKITKAYSNYGF